MDIIIPGKPIAKKRARFSRRGKYVVTYNDQRKEEEGWILLAKSQITDFFKDIVWVTLIFYMPRPKSHYGTGEKSARLKANAPIYHTKKPDVDNLVKFCLDCLNGLAWQDDSQISEMRVRKIYSEEPRTEITIGEII